jgi:hypothetical protein
VATSERPDVVTALRDPRLETSGISVLLKIDASHPAPDRVTLCVWTEDAELGRHLLSIPSRPELCPIDAR